MPQVQMDIPEELIKAAAAERIEELERKLKNAENREAVAKRKLASQETDLRIAANIIRTFKDLIDDHAYDLDVYLGDYA